MEIIVIVGFVIVILCLQKIIGELAIIRRMTEMSEREKNNYNASRDEMDDLEEYCETDKEIRERLEKWGKGNGKKES